MYHQNLQGCFGLGKEGLSSDFIKPLKTTLENSVDTLRNSYKEGGLPLLRLPYFRKDIEDLKELVLRLQDDFSDVIILGTGGSSLGGKALCALSSQSNPKLHFLDNIDPHTFLSLCQKIEIQSTAVIAISKSGSTPETMMQFLLLAKKWLKEIGPQALKNHFIILTENKTSPFKIFADRWEIPFLEHDPKLGGRFSVLSSVGLLPAMIAGLNPVAVREGAAYVFDKLLETNNVLELDPVLGAAVQYTLATKHNISQSVLMPYVDRLSIFSKWYRQLWAESLGKNGKGTTPIDALGAVDQHSQLQLYLDGPCDKFFTVVTLDHMIKGPKVLADIAHDLQVEFLLDATMADLIEAEQKATIDTLIANNRPTRHIHLPELNEGSMGALMMHFMLETIVMADLYKINAFDQQAVEQGKKLAKSYLVKKIKEQEHQPL
ncbi:MAG: glucose-6-phosphate isomerase [Alphaproteobacteria bacterium]